MNEEKVKLIRDSIEKGLDDKNLLIRLSAVNHPFATINHFKKALSDENELVRTSAFFRLKDFLKEFGFLKEEQNKNLAE